MSDVDTTLYLDEVMETMNPDLMFTHEMQWNPKAPKTKMEMSIPNEPLFLLVERTKDFEWNPYHREKAKEARSLCQCGANMHKWSDIVEKSYLDRTTPCWKCGGSWGDTYGEEG